MVEESTRGLPAEHTVNRYLNLNYKPITPLRLLSTPIHYTISFVSELAHTYRCHLLQYLLCLHFIQCVIEVVLVDCLQKKVDLFARLWAVGVQYAQNQSFDNVGLMML